MLYIASYWMRKFISRPLCMRFQSRQYFSVMANVNAVVLNVHRYNYHTLQFKLWLVYYIFVVVHYLIKQRKFQSWTIGLLNSIAPCTILIMQSVRLGSNKYQFLSHCFDSSGVPTHDIRIPWSPKTGDWRSTYVAIPSGKLINRLRKTLTCFVNYWAGFIIYRQYTAPICVHI